MRYFEILEASRYATITPDEIASLGKTPIGQYLYHGTPLDCVLNIIKTNTLNTGQEYRGEGDRVALTRSYAIAEEFAGYSSGGQEWGYRAVLVFDWAKLARDYEIHPYRDTYHGGGERNDEQEEAVYGNIRPLSKYVVSINVAPDEFKSAMNDADWIAMCLEEKSFIRSKRGLFGMMKKLNELPILNKIK
jgi:hypothetical protein